jgi:hypothetical protein
VDLDLKETKVFMCMRSGAQREWRS